MAELWFYHLEGMRAEAMLPDFLQKTLDKGWRAAVRVPDRETAERVDAALWLAADDSFIPHGRAGPDDDLAERQPIWITEGDDVPNGADLLVCVDGAAVDAKRAADFKRTAYLFDARNESVAASARTLWKSAAEFGLSRTYWTRSEHGGWTKSG